MLRNPPLRKGRNDSEWRAPARAGASGACVGRASNAAQTTQEVWAALSGKRQPALTEHDTNEEDAEHFMRYAMAVPEGFVWDMDVGDVEAAILHTTGSAPGPDGVPYAAWRSVSTLVAPVLHRILRGVVEGTLSLPADFNVSTMVFLPKMVPVGMCDTFSAEVDALRPLTLADIGPKALALTVNRRLSEHGDLAAEGVRPSPIPRRQLV